MQLKNLVSSLLLLEPSEINRKKIRIGPPMDGGYVCAEPILRQPILAIGAGYNIDFEVELADRGHKVLLLDHTVDEAPKKHENINFIKRGIAASSSEDGTMCDLAAAIRHGGWEGRTDLFLKIDVEGSEFDVLGTCVPSVIKSFTQIVMEVHWLTKLSHQSFRDSYEQMMRNILSEFVLFHVHGNNCGSANFVGGVDVGGGLGEIGGLPVIDVLELSFIRKDLVIFAPNKTVYPTPLDYPNDPNRPDHMLAFFPFLPSRGTVPISLEGACKANELSYRLAHR